MDNNKTDEFSIDDLLSSRLINTGEDKPPVVEDEDIFSLNSEDPIFADNGVEQDIDREEFNSKTGNRFEVTPPVMDRSGEIKQLEQQVVSLQQENRELKLGNESADPALMEELEALKEENTALKKDVGDSKQEARIISLEKQNDFLKEENTELLTHKVDTENRCKVAENLTEELKVENRNLEDKLQHLSKELEDLDIKLKESEEKILTKDDEINRIAEDFSRKETQLFEEISNLDDRIKQSETDFSAKLEDMQNSFEDLKRSKIEVETELQEVKSRNSELNSSIQGLELRIEAVRSDNELLEIKNSDLNKRIEGDQELLGTIRKFFIETSEKIGGTEDSEVEEDGFEDVEISSELD